MKPTSFKRQIYWLAFSILILFSVPCFAETPGQGSLTVIEPDGKLGQDCPLEHTSVKGEISGFIARVSVTQVFHNPMTQKIEAIYTFPLSADGAVDDMVMKVGNRTVRGTIKKREEARQIYEDAKKRGSVASLLDQERPNIFTQSVANIMPGEKVEITIQYVELLAFNDGAFKFVFPMVVGPRFIPGKPENRKGTGWAPDTDKVPDASRITPPVTPKGTRAGHDIDLTVNINAGVPILGLESKLHDVDIRKDGDQLATVSLKNKKEIPNRDFVLEYLVSGDEVKSGVLAHKTDKEGYVTIVMIPPKRVAQDQVAPRELIFVIDCSGSQRGKPLEKAKETMRYVIDKMNPNDTFNIIDFNAGARVLFETPKPNTPDNRAKALTYLQSLEAQGGTWMGPAVELTCKMPAPENRLRIVTFMTDGYVGNDFEIISLVKQLRGKSRWFPFGTGHSVNRFLLDQMARVGGGETEYILLDSPGEKVAARFYERIATPVLTDIALTTKGINLEQIYPESVSDLWSRKPLIFKARYSKAGKGVITLRGFSGGKAYEQNIDVDLPEIEGANAALASLWARAKVDDLMDRDWMNIQRGTPENSIKDEIVKVALEHKIMTQFTSFVAVEETIITVAGQPITVTVPVEMPDGVSREGVFGEKDKAAFTPLGSGIRAFMPTAPANVAGHYRPDFKSSLSGAAQVKLKRQDASKPTTPSEAKESYEKSERNSSESKIEPQLLEFIKLTREKRAQSPYRTSMLMEDGKITVKLWLNSTSEKVLNELKKLGFEVTFSATAANIIIGKIELEKVLKIAKLNEVKRIEPIGKG